MSMQKYLLRAQVQMEANQKMILLVHHETHDQGQCANACCKAEMENVADTFQN